MTPSNATEMVQTTRDLTEIQDDQSAFIILPVSLFEEISPEDNTSQIGLFFTFYEQPVLFPLGSESRPDISVGSAVIGASFSSGDVSNLTEGVNISTRLFIKVQLHNCVTALCG